MLHNATYTFLEKKKHFHAMHQEKQLHSKLFFAARNLSIASLIRAIELYFKKKGFLTECAWRESSFGPYAYLVITFMDKSGLEYNVNLVRESIARIDWASDLFYSRKGHIAEPYYPYALSAHHLAFRQELKDASFLEWLDKHINLVNYPFIRVLPKEEKATLLKSAQENKSFIQEQLVVSQQFAFARCERALEDLFKTHHVEAEVSSLSHMDRLGFLVSVAKGKHTMAIWLTSEREHHVELNLDFDFFSYHETVVLLDKSKAKSAILAKALIEDSAFIDKMKPIINGTNYPFMYESLSSF